MVYDNDNIGYEYRYSGKSVFLFGNKWHNSLRALRWEQKGFILVTKFLSDDMKFQWSKNQGEIRDIINGQMETNVINIKERTRPVRTKGDRGNSIKALPHKVIECVLNAEEAMCKVCGSELKIIGKKKVISEMEYIPAKLIMKDYVQYVYKCVQCVECG